MPKRKPALQPYQIAENAIIATGKCPYCSRPLRRNLALTGWYQCEQFGAPSFRKDPAAAACNWQGFYTYEDNR